MLPATTNEDRPTREFLISCLSGGFREACESLPPEIASLSPDEILQEQRIVDIDYFLRKNLWKQAELCQKGALGEIEAASVYRGVCTRQGFEKILKNPHRVAWLLTYPWGDMALMEAGVSMGLRQVIDFMAKPISADTATAFLKALEMLLNRVHGPVAQVQRIDKRSAHVNLNKPVAAPTAGSAERLEELKQKILARDVTPDGGEPT